MRIWLFGIPTIKSNIQVEYAFTIDNIDYFRFVNFYEIPSERAYAIAGLFEQFNMRMTKDDLNVCVSLIKEELSKQVTNLNKIREVVEIIESKQQDLLEIETYYNLAAVLFVTKDENIGKYDEVVTEKKKRHFMKADIPSFFLTIPLRELNPFSNAPRSYIKNTIEQILKKQVKELEKLKSLSQESQSGESMSSEIQSIELKMKQISGLIENLDILNT